MADASAKEIVWLKTVDLEYCPCPDCKKDTLHEKIIGWGADGKFYYKYHCAVSTCNHETAPTLRPV